MQKTHWLLQSPHVLAVPILTVQMINNISHLCKLSNFHDFIIMATLGTLALMFGLLKSKKILSTTFIITGCLFLIHVSFFTVVIYYKIPTTYFFTACSIALFIFGLYLYAQRNKGK